MDIPQPGIEVDSDGFLPSGLHSIYYKFDFKSNILLNCKSKKTVKIQTIWKEIQKLKPADEAEMRNVTLKKKILKRIDKILQIDDNLSVALYNKGILLVDEWGYPHQHLNDKAMKFLGKACGIRPMYIKFLEKAIERLEDDHWKGYYADITASYTNEIYYLEKIIEETQDVDHVIKNFLDCWDVIELLEFGKMLTKYLRYEESLQFFNRANEVYPTDQELALKPVKRQYWTAFRSHFPGERLEITHNEVKKLFKKAAEDAFHKKYKDLTVLEKKYLAYISLQNSDPRIINPIEFKKSFNQWKTTYCRIKLKSKK